MVEKESSFNPDAEFAVPTWIDEELVQKALHNGREENIKVTGVAVEPATEPGDNYSSVVYRVKFTLPEGTERSLIIKGPPLGKNVAAWSEGFGMFTREAAVLSEIFPQIQALLEEAAPGKFPPLGARCYLHGTHPVEFLVLEDLGPEGFKMADRKRGLGLRHSLVALRALARFHAASHALLRKKPELASNPQLSNPWRQPHHGMDQFVDAALQATADICRSWPGYEEYATPLEKLKPVVMTTGIEFCDPKPEGFNVITHADYWVNNMMFCYENGNPRAHRMLDLQGSFIASPAIDILYFLSTSVSENVSINHEDLLLREYHFTLKETLSLLGMQAPSLEELLADLDAYGLFAVMGAVCVIPMIKAERALDFDATLTGDQSAMDYLYQSKDLQRWLQRVLPVYRRRGWLPG